MPPMSGLHNVPSAHSFSFVKQDRYTCYMRTVYWQNGEQVMSRTVLTLRFQLVSRGPLGSWHAPVSTREILAYLQVAPSNHEDWKQVQPRSVTEVDCSACRGMEVSFLAGWIDRRISRGTVCEKKRVQGAHAHLHDVCGWSCRKIGP